MILPLFMRDPTKPTRNLQDTSYNTFRLKEKCKETQNIYCIKDESSPCCEMGILITNNTGDSFCPGTE